MFERFTEQAIQVIMYAQEESRLLGHNIVGTELFFLGLIREDKGIAAKVLKSMGVNLENARTEVEKILGRGDGYAVIEIPFTPEGKRLLELSVEEARQLEHTYISTEHILLSLLRLEDKAIAQILENLGVNPQDVRAGVIHELSTETDGTPENNLSVVVTSASVEQKISQLTTMLTGAKALISEIEKELKIRVVSTEDIAKAINQLPNSSEPNQPSIKELLTQLHQAIEADSDLASEDKAEALEQVMVLAEVVQNPFTQGMQKSARTALKILKGTLVELSETTQLVGECNSLLPAIAIFFSTEKPLEDFL